MRACLLLLAGLASGLVAQDQAGNEPGSRSQLRIARRVASPVLYMGIEPGVPETAVPALGVADLLVDPVVLSAAGLDSATRDVSIGPALRVLRRLVADAAAAGGAVEVAITSMLPRGEAPALPLLVLRVCLDPSLGERLRAQLDRPGFAVLDRKVGRGQVYRLGLANGLAADRESAPGPGEVIEVAVTGRELIVSNHRRAIEQLLIDVTDEARHERYPLTSQPAYRSLRQQLEIGPGSVLLYADLTLLRPWLRAAMDAETHWLLDSSGLTAARRVACALRPHEEGIQTSILLDDRGAPDGWLSLAEPVRAVELAQRVSPSAIGGVAFAVQPGRVLAQDPNSAYGAGLAELRTSLLGGCSRLGLDAERQVIRRLGNTLAIDLVSERGVAEPVFHMQAKSAAAARSLFTECKTLANRERRASVQDGARGAEQVILLPHTERPLHVAVRRDQLLMAFDQPVLEASLRAAGGRSRTQRARFTKELISGLQSLGAAKREVQGVFTIDAERLLPELVQQHPQSSLVLRSHVGYLQRMPQLTRIEVLTRL
ncbi:MAG: hypothetical protein AAF628_27650 [Planctomycetota bacterium]